MTERLRTSSRQNIGVKLGCLTLAAASAWGLAGCSSPNTPTTQAKLDCTTAQRHAVFFIGVYEPGFTWGANVDVRYGAGEKLEAWGAMTQWKQGDKDYSKYDGGEGKVPAQANPTSRVKPGDLVTIVPVTQERDPIVTIYAETDRMFSVRCNGWQDGDPKETVGGPKPMQTAI